MNNVTLIGRLARDPELRYTQQGTAVTNFTIAVDKELPKQKEQELQARGEPTADFIDIVTWGNVAENIPKFTKKGLRVAVQGRIQTGSYQTKEGQTRKTFEINAYRVEFIDWKDKTDDFTPQGNDEIIF